MAVWENCSVPQVSFRAVTTWDRRPSEKLAPKPPSLMLRFCVWQRCVLLLKNNCSLWQEALIFGKTIECPMTYFSGVQIIWQCSFTVQQNDKLGILRVVVWWEHLEPCFRTIWFSSHLITWFNCRVIWFSHRLVSHLIVESFEWQNFRHTTYFNLYSIHTKFRLPTDSNLGAWRLIMKKIIKLWLESDCEIEKSHYSKTNNFPTK